jgi:light-regulated signal transduction histidine kinase (bacteriophytochrome)
MDRSGAKLKEGEMERLRASLEAEVQLRIQAQRLSEQAGQDFEEFVSVAVHDLRECLREVGAYSELMSEPYAGRLDSDAELFLSHIQNGVARMQALLSGMLEYGSAGSGNNQPSWTEMEAVLQQALLCSDKALKAAGAIVTHDPLPAVMGDFEGLTKVLQHLIGNAVKFAGSAAPRVHVSSKRNDAGWVFSVRDNGPGIDPAHRDRIFGVFKRLHGKEYPGNGLGLAFCKKVIEWHGGRIWVESPAGEGSTFYFTLPPAD